MFRNEIRFHSFSSPQGHMGSEENKNGIAEKSESRRKGKRGAGRERGTQPASVCFLPVFPRRSKSAWDQVAHSNGVI